MTAEPLTVLYVHNASTVGGGNKVLLGLFDHIDRQRFLPISILPAPGPMESELAARHVSFHVVSQDRTLATRSRVEAVRCTLEFVCVVMKARPALLHANGVLSYRYASLACRLSRARRICHIHHPGEVQSAAWALRVRPHAIVTVSSVMFAEVSEHVSRLSRPPSVIQITNAVDTAAFVPCPNQVALREQTELSRFSFLVIIVGSVTEHKGHRLFLEMARRLLEIEPRAGFLVVGEDFNHNGAYRREMESLTVALGISSSVVFYGFASDDVTRTLMAASDVFVLPTREEGFGLALAEAQACGIPVVSTTVGPIPQVVSDGATGILVPVGDVSALTAAVVSLLKDADRRRAMGARGRERAVDLFGPERYAREVEGLYQKVLYDSGSTGRRGDRHRVTTE